MDSSDLPASCLLSIVTVYRPDCFSDLQPWPSALLCSHPDPALCYRQTNRMSRWVPSRKTLRGLIVPLVAAFSALVFTVINDIVDLGGQYVGISSNLGH